MHEHVKLGPAVVPTTRLFRDQLIRSAVRKTSAPFCSFGSAGILLQFARSVCMNPHPPNSWNHISTPHPSLRMPLSFFFIPCTTQRLAWFVFFTIETDTTVQTEQSSTNRDQIKSITWSAGAKVFFWSTRRPNRTTWTKPPEPS